MNPQAELKALGFYVLNDCAATAEVKIDNRGRKIAVLIKKTRPVMFESIGRMVHGLGRRRFYHYKEVATLGRIETWLAFYEMSGDRLLMQEIRELDMNMIPCKCAACRMHDYEKCKMEAGGMLFFDCTKLFNFAQSHDHLVKSISTDQLSLFE